jgi:hypothetical protein
MGKHPIHLIRFEQMNGDSVSDLAEESWLLTIKTSPNLSSEIQRV